MAGLLLSFIFMCFFHEIQGQAPPRPELTVNPPVITETDSVTLNCMTPSYISVFRCHINTLSGVPIESFSCRRTLTGTELLKISHQSSPSVVQVICFYSVQLGQVNSPYSDTSSINIQNSVHKNQGQALPPPELTVNPPVITETDSVTLDCVTPPYISVTRCYFFTVTRVISEYDCVQTLKLSELLKMVQSLPADIEVRCIYSVMSGASSPHSDPSTISIKTLPPPKVTVNPPVITETDSVTLNCQTPSSLSVTHCFFYTVNEVALKTSSLCLQTLTGTELLNISQQSSPSDVQVRCFYSVQTEHVDFRSQFSHISSITIQSLKPEMSLQSFEGDDVFFICSLPQSVKRGTRCNLYFGEVNRPFQTTTAKQKISKTKQWFCHFTIPVDDLLRYLDSVQQKDASCDYKLEREQNTLSPRSDRRNLTADIVGRESSSMNKNSTFTVTAAGSNVTMSSASTPATSVNLTSGSLPANLSPPNTVTFAVKTTVNPTRRGNDADAVGRESSVSTRSSFTVTTGSTVIMSDVSTPATSGNPRQANTGLRLFLPVGFGASMAVVFMVLMLRRRLKRRTATINRSGRSSSKTNANITDDSVSLRNINHGGVQLPDNNTYSLITSVPRADCSTGFEKLNREEPQSQDSDIYHLYDTIPEQPTASDRPDMLYSLLQAH